MCARGSIVWWLCREQRRGWLLGRSGLVGSAGFGADDLGDCGCHFC
jgi:hypothetical protein